MIDIVTSIDEFLDKSDQVAIARVIKTWRSSPRPVGSALLVNEKGDMLGSVSGGCVENAVVRKAKEVMETGISTLAEYGVGDEEAWEVGLSCGGQLSVLITPFFDHADWDIIRTCRNMNKGLVVINELADNFTCSFIDPTTTFDLGESLNKEVLEAYRIGQSKIVELEDKSYFLHVMPPKNKMLLIGSAHITTEMIGLAKRFGFETVVIDPRDTFAKQTTYALEPDHLIVKWPQEVLNEFELDQNTYCVILSHDPKIDDEALKILLRSNVKYIGALGSKKTHAKRVGRLNAYGFSEEEITKIHSPIGLYIGSHTPNEIALSIMAEVIKVKNA